MNPARARQITVEADALLNGSSVALECLLAAARRRPWVVAQALMWAARGREHLVRELLPRSGITADALPYSAGAVDAVRREAAAGTRVGIAAPGAEELACKMVLHLGLAGSPDGGEAWKPPAVSRRVTAGVLWRSLRPYHWLKNMLVFLPFLLAHEFGAGEKWASAALMFAAFSACASAGYVVNDILDRAQDRRHPRRSLRPIASGALPVGTALWLPVPLMAVAAACCFFLPPACPVVLGAYVVLTVLYSGGAKKLLMADVLLLAGLHLLRLIAGSLATGNVVSSWLFAFALTLFLSLAMAKRVSELMAWQSMEVEHAPGRGYRAIDAPVLEMMAVASGFLACLIMVLYIQSPEILRLYRRPEYLWCGVVALLYWLGRLFLYAHRGECPDDPLFFALQDKTTRLVVVSAAALAILAV